MGKLRAKGIKIETRSASNGQKLKYVRVRIMDKGKEFSWYLGTTKEVTIKNAIEFRKKKLHELKNANSSSLESERHDVPTNPVQQTVVPTIREFSKEFLYFQQHEKKIRTWKKVSGQMKLLNEFYISEKECCIGDFRLNEMRPGYFREFQKQKNLEGMENATINRYRTVLLRLFNLAINWELVDIANPIAKTPTLPENNSRDRVLSSGEEERLFQALKPWFVPIVLTGLNTGLRMNEIRTLKWKHVDLDNSTLYIDESISKNSKPRYIPLNRNLRILFLYLYYTDMKDSEYVFLNSRGKPYQYHGLRKTWIHSREKAGLEEVWIHDFRRTFSTRLLQKGVSETVIDELLGHVDKSVRKRYLHPPNEMMRNAVELLVDFNSDFVNRYLRIEKSSFG